MRCETHGKELVTSCQWCGKKLCRDCIGKSTGKKAYCKKCSSEIGDYIERRQREQIRKQEEAEKRKKDYKKILETY
ncbi:MAG: hypothetical protein R6U32_02545 [Candidatus Woesearchaeota archaeon]